ncbi:uncharacterized protein A4U43_C09F14380 [Asparagus officinalis]|uniref:Sacsin/Nov domain-containing protein n=1 Tax=Asparagus officinalis TaxID=4686 RepID=A0A5P1EAL6_ASPOF|nr:uncharacterized protein A4U43_C09F14380 [Asparagus officinalis]
MEKAREHIESIRRDRFFIGREQKNPLAEDMHQAVNYLSEELYAKDVHFLMELIQNAEDNEYPAGTPPSLEFLITSKDLAATGASATLLVFNNEKGFSPANIESICRVGKSTKKGCRNRGYIGEKGIGFKSVFLVSSQPHVFSNGYQIRFNEEPCPECNIGYIVPEWVEDNLMLSNIKQVYGPSTKLPTTTIILPLKVGKVAAVKQQLSKMHPEILLFLSKIKQLAVREENDDPRLNTVSQISISSETDVEMRKNVDAESYTRHLAAQENGKGEEEECSYYMWKQTFPVKSDCRVKKRMEVDEWVIILAFPWGQRLNRGLTTPGIYSFLPTEMVTNFPFIIQADLLLSSSRESILLDSPWNKGILECVPSAFTNAFVSLVKSTPTAPPSCISSMFRFLPVKSSKIPLMDSVRQSIKEKVVAEHIVPCESRTSQKFFSKPGEVGRLMPEFWNILDKVEKLKVDFKNLSSHGIYCLSSSLDRKENDEVLDFLGVGFVDKQWYGNCIQSSNLVREVTEEVYLDLLCFLANKWQDFFKGTNMANIPLIKYVDVSGSFSLRSINGAASSSQKIGIASESKNISWLISWSREFLSSAIFFVPQNTQTVLATYPRQATIISWLKSNAEVQVLDVYNYGLKALPSLRDDRRHVIAFVHFLYHSCSKGYLTEWAVKELCSRMPLVNSYGNVTAQTKKTLVPAKCSRWVGLLGSNVWIGEGYVEMGADYIMSGNFAGNYTAEKILLPFLENHIGASDVPKICPPNAPFSTASSPLTKENTFLLLEWISKLKYRGIQIPQRFLHCIKSGSWLKTSVGYKPPSVSFLSNSDWGSLLRMESTLIDIPMVDQRFYDYKLGSYKEELRFIGVRFDFVEASTYIGNHLMSLAANSTLSSGNVISLLDLIRALREKKLSPEHLISSIKHGSWLKTSQGYRSPVGAVLKTFEWTTASLISNLPFIDQGFYGDRILNYGTELQLLGVVVGLNHNHQHVVDNFKLTSPVAADAAILILDCIRYVKSSEVFISKLRGLSWVRTHTGYKMPRECFLVDSKWECLLEVVDEVPLVDQAFYSGRIGSYKEELKKAGVLVSFEEASKAIANRFKLLSSSSTLTKKNVFALLSSYRQLTKISYRFPSDLTNCIHTEKWIRTRTGFRSPKESILFEAEWESVSPIATLPFIDDTEAYYGKGIYEYKDELKALGCTVEFKEGAHFVVTSLNIPKDPSSVSAPSCLSLLKCIRNLKKKKAEIFPKQFMASIDKKWLKTAMGYRFPGECIVYDSKWEPVLERGDGPFLDQDFYGSDISTYGEELKMFGVIVGYGNGCKVLADHLKCHCQTNAIVRVYKYLMEFKWEPEDGASDWIWIPDGAEGGKWVGSYCCVLSDKDDLFSSQLYVLDKYYERKLLGFFSLALKVKNVPTVEDYCKLWYMWESALHQPTEAECIAFWVFIAKHWFLKTTNHLLERITKVPVLSGNGIELC